jgi:hypothetical protein
MPHLSKPQATVLALYSFGMVIAQSCGLTSVAVVLGMLLDRKETTMRQRLREFYQDANDKRGTNRQAVVVTTCFAPLVQWVLTWWTPDERRLVLAMDATPLRDCFTVLSIAVVYCGCAIPVAWVVVEATAKGGWQPHWCRLFNLLRGVVPRDWLVLVLADRGLYAQWLFRKIRKLGWHPFLRIKHHYQVRPEGLACWRPITDLIAPGAASWSGRVTCFTTPEARLDCTLLLSWAAGAAEPWVIVTDLAPETAQVAWYGMRAWIEGGYKDVKRGGFHWEQTKMDDPARAARLWLVIAVATLRVVSLGGAARPDQPASSLPDLSAPLADRTATASDAPRTVSCFRRGMLRVVCALITQRPIPEGHFAPDPWPDRLPTRPAAQRPPPEWLATSRMVWLVLIALMQAQERAGQDTENP